MTDDISGLEKCIGYSFHDRSLIVKALTHTSYANEKSSKHGRNENNQRLEFLGDSVLSTIVSTYLYKHYGDMNEGSMSKLRASVVCESSLAEIARKICLQEYLLLGHGEELSGGRNKPSIQADAFESLLAAVYLDGGFKAAVSVLMDTLDMPDYIKKHAATYGDTDYKTKLQESVNTSCTDILYEIFNVDGPAHDCTYSARVTVTDKQTGRKNSAEGTGRSKKDAEQHAAGVLLEKLGFSSSNNS